MKNRPAAINIHPLQVFLYVMITVGFLIAIHVYLILQSIQIIYSSIPDFSHKNNGTSGCCPCLSTCKDRNCKNEKTVDPDMLNQRFFILFRPFRDQWKTITSLTLLIPKSQMMIYMIFYSSRWTFHPVSIFFFTLLMVSASRSGQSVTVLALLVTRCAFSAHKASGVSARESE